MTGFFAASLLRANQFNEQVTRNIDKFDPDFMFELTRNDFQIMVVETRKLSQRQLPGF